MKDIGCDIIPGMQLSLRRHCCSSSVPGSMLVQQVAEHKTVLTESSCEMTGKLKMRRKQAAQLRWHI